MCAEDFYNQAVHITRRIIAALKMINAYLVCQQYRLDRVTHTTQRFHSVLVSEHITEFLDACVLLPCQCQSISGSQHLTLPIVSGSK